MNIFLLIYTTLNKVMDLEEKKLYSLIASSIFQQDYLQMLGIYDMLVSFLSVLNCRCHVVCRMAKNILKLILQKKVVNLKMIFITVFVLQLTVFKTFVDHLFLQSFNSNLYICCSPCLFIICHLDEVVHWWWISLKFKFWII